MYKGDFINAYALKHKCTKKEAGRIIEDMFDLILDTCKSGDIVQITGKGTFFLRQNKERVGRNPSTKEEIIIPASSKVVFDPGKDFRNV